MEDTKSIRIAGLQMQSVAGDIEANLARIATGAAEARVQGATLMIAPELCVTGYGIGEIMLPLAETANGAIVSRLSDVARETGVAIVAGFAERDGDVVFNSAVHTDGTAAPVVYRKSSLYGDYERGLFRQADPSTVLFPHRGFTCGLLICYDVEFPENVRRLALAGADAVFVPTALPAGWSAMVITDHMIATRAFENQIFVAYINQWGADPQFSFSGLSRIAAPDGGLLASAPAQGPLLMIADLVPADFAASRAENTYLRDLHRT